MKYVKQFLEYFRAFPTFTANDARLFLQKGGANSDYYMIFMHNLIKSGRAFSIKKGYYTLYDDLTIASFAFSPFYFGLETALTYHNLWDYMTPISIITTKTVRSGQREIIGRNVDVRRIQKSKFFGYSMVQYKDGFYMPMADIEKTLIDSVYFHTIFSKEVYANMSRKIDKKKLDMYLRSYDKEFRVRAHGRLQDVSDDVLYAIATERIIKDVKNRKKVHGLS